MLPITDPDHWLELAKAARDLAELIDDPRAKSTMLSVADEYELSAKNSENKQVTGSFSC
jgi:hypothetical protein